jgi:hypothetical protein
LEIDMIRLLSTAGVLAASLALASPVSALSFTFSDGGGDGFGSQTLDSGSDFILYLAGNDDGQEEVFTTFTATAAADGTISGWWAYFTDDLPSYDPAGFFVESVVTQLTDPGEFDPQDGTFSFSVQSGDEFGFYVESIDGVFGRGFASFSTTGPIDLGAVPLPAGLPLLVTGFGLLAVARKRRRG